MTDSIVLPCGVVLTKEPEPMGWAFTFGPIRLELRLYRGNFENENDWIAGMHTLGVTHADVWRRPKAECIAWLDARVLELRRALMPPDAREIVARALCCDAEEFASDPIVWARMTRAADAVLKALRGGR